MHVLPRGRAAELAEALIGRLRSFGRLDVDRDDDDADPALAFDRLFASGRGHMFGVLECRGRDGEAVVLKDFSSLRGGIRVVDGWVPPLLDEDTWRELIEPNDREIKRLGHQAATLAVGLPRRQQLLDDRRQRSRAFNAELQSRYRLRNFRGEERSLSQAWAGDGGLPGGVGECCAPKLLHRAAVLGLRPVGIAEFCWGGPLGELRPGDFAPSCAQRCQPLLGFLLCGLEER